MDKLRIDVLPISGKPLAVEIEAQSTVACVKKRLAEQSRLPPACQKLIIGTDVLEEADTLTAHCQNASANLAVTLIVSIDHVLLSLEHNAENWEKWEAFRALIQLGHWRADRGASNARCHRLEHSVPEVGQALATALDGDDRCLETLLALLESQDSIWRRIAVDALARTTSVGTDERALFALMTRLEDIDEDVRRSALLSLVRVVDAGISLTEWPSWLAHHEARVQGILQRRAADNQDDGE